MDEMIIVYQASLALLGACVACFFYSWGGRSGKWKRRFIASLILACTINGICVWRGMWDPWQLLLCPILIGALSNGYGAESLGGKILRRSIYVAGFLISGLIMVFTIDGWAWGVFIIHSGVAAWSVFLGVKNPIYAAAEEAFICMLLNLGLMMYPFVTQAS